LPLDRDEITMLVKRGKDFLTNGDLASARLLLQRAAEAGSADAAMALGATFDPLVIRRLGAIGAEPDAARARQWYQKAVALGAAGAAQPLAKLEAAAQ
jgi:TPR repeat protein